MTENRVPQVGDKFVPVFQSDIPEGEHVELEIAEVYFLCDDGETWSISASDGEGYDAVWSDRYQVWCYNLG